MTITVIVLAHGSTIGLGECLQSLQSQQTAVEQIVVAGWGFQTPFKHGANVAVQRCSNRSALPELIQFTMLRTSSDVVVLTSTQCCFPPDWTTKLIHAYESKYDVVGGAVRHRGPFTLLGWACYFSEYGAFSPDGAPSTEGNMAGNHVSYRRTAVLEILAAEPRGYWKYMFHQNLARSGVRFLFDPRIEAEVFQSDTLSDFLVKYFWNAYWFSKVRSWNAGALRRFTHVAFSPALVLLLLSRRIRAAWHAKPHRIRLLCSIPHLLLFVSAWSAGEALGWSGWKVSKGLREPLAALHDFEP